MNRHALTLLLTILLLPLPGHAQDGPPTTPEEARCRQEIVYSWKRIPPPRQDSARTPEPTSDPSLLQPMEVVVLVLVEEGAPEDELKGRLAERLPEALANARIQCQKTHENIGQCSAGKLGALLEDLTRVDFETRRNIKERVIADCEKNSGVCIGAKAKEIQCTVVKKSVTPIAEQTPAAKESKKK